MNDPGSEQIYTQTSYFCTLFLQSQVLARFNIWGSVHVFNRNTKDSLRPSSSLKRISLSSVTTLNYSGANFIQLETSNIPQCFIKGKVIRSSLALPEEDEEHIKNYPARFDLRRLERVFSCTRARNLHAPLLRCTRQRNESKSEREE